MRTKIVTLQSGQQIKLFHRDDMRASRPKRARASLPPQVPATTLPVDSSGNGTCPCPMDGNDSLGDCGPVMCAHVNGLRSYGQGKPGFAILQAPVAPLEQQYETVSGGDNGTTEDMLVGNAGGAGGSSGPGIWLEGIAGDPSATVADHLDLGDGSDAPLIQFCLDQFYAVCKAWSVPDEVLQTFQSGTSYLTPLPYDAANGHFTPFSDADADGNYRDWTWGGWFWESPAFMAATQPECFVTFSHLQFSNATGYDSKGRHVSDQAAKWIAIGGNASIVNALVATFPAKTGSNPPATPSTPSTPPPSAPPSIPPLGPGGGSGPVGPAA
jgi:hypothetical protein